MPVVTGEQLSLKVATIGRRPQTDTELSDATCTPKLITDLLPTVEFDPCSNARSHVKAHRRFSLDDGVNGLEKPWNGTGYMNHPFSDPLPFCKKAIEELASGRCTDLIVMCKHDESTEWWETITAFNPAAAYGEPLSMPPEKWALGRIPYDEHPELIERRRIKQAAKRKALGKDPSKATGKSSVNFCSAIIHHRGFQKIKINGRQVRRPRLNLWSIAKLWLLALDDKEEIVR